MNTTHRLVRPAHLNQFGYLFGGQLLAWVDEASWIAASIRFPGCKFVTIGMESVTFKHPVHEGAILRIDSSCKHIGNSSIRFAVEVHSNQEDQEKAIFSTLVSFVNVDDQGRKVPLPSDN